MRSDLESVPSELTPAHAATRAWLEPRGDAILAEQIEIARTPAPPFEERARAELIASRLATTPVVPEFDEVGNLIATHREGGATGGEVPIVVAAHLDTVFGPETPIRIRREGDRWIGPGVADNARGLAVTLALIRALAAREVVTAHPIVWAFTVGEEAHGDLRGVKHLFGDDSLSEAKAFIALDGSGLRRVIHRALGCRRFRVTVSGPGGHSWTDWGRPNPAHVVGTLVARLADMALPQEPRTTLTTARLGGGTSINAIPAEAWLELDLRSESASELERTEAEVRRALHASLEAEEGRTGSRPEARIDLIGERPAGRIPTSHPLTAAAVAATRRLGEEPELCASSTDANVPLSLGVPAIGLGAGGRSGDAHTEHEWFEDIDGAAGAVRALAVLAPVAGF